MSWRSALWEKVSLTDAEVAVEDRQADTSFGAVENAGAGSLKANRRAEPRYAAADLPAITTVMLSGEVVTLVNISSSGVLVESSTRFKPSERVRLGITGLEPNQVGGVIVRCMVSAISTGGKLRYESAIAFTQPVNIPVPPGTKPTSKPVPAATPAPAAKLAASASVASVPAFTAAPVPPTPLPTAAAPAPEESSSEEVVVEFPRVLPRVRNRW
jgi:hypothetical protein